MGCFSNMDITRPRPFDGWIDYSYPTRRETLGWFMEDLVSALEERNISLAELVVHCLKEKYGMKHQRELQIRTGKTRKGISGGDRSLPAVA